MKTIYKNRNRFGNLFILLFFLACNNSIHIDPIPYSEKISIQCLITPGQIPVLNLNRTVAFLGGTYTEKDLFISNAIAMITTTGGDTFRFHTDSAFSPIKCRMEYFYKATKPVVANTAYHLRISVNGKLYEASAHTNLLPVTPDSVNYIPAFKDLYGEHEGVLVHITDPPGKGQFYRYYMTRIINDTITDVFEVSSLCSINQPTYVLELGRSVYSDAHLDGSSFTVAIEPAYKHKPDQVGYVRLQTVDENTFIFYDNLDRQRIAAYNPFVEPVFLQPGQFGKEGIGVFGAYALSEDSVEFTYPE